MNIQLSCSFIRFYFRSTHNLKPQSKSAGCTDDKGVVMEVFIEVAKEKCKEELRFQ